MTVWVRGQDNRGGEEKHASIATRKLLFKKVVEGLAGIERPRRSGCFHGGGLRGLRVGCRSSVFFDGHSKFVEGAGVFRVFGRNALGDGLRTFELRAGVKEAALLATVKLEIALWTLSLGVETWSEHRAAIGTTCASNGANHARSAWT